MRRITILMTGIGALLSAACSGEARPPATANAGPPAVAARLATAPTFRKSASDAAIWVDAADANRSLLLVSGGEGGLEMNDLTGAGIARIESLEAGFIDVRQNVTTTEGTLDLVIASDQRLGAVQVYKLDAASHQVELITAAPIEVHDAVTGLCTYASALTGKLYAFVATDQGQLEQWELFIDKGKANGRFIRRIAAGKGVAHCVADDATGAVYFSEESVGIWQVAAEPESDAARTPVDLIEPRGSLHEEVKGVALYRRAGQTPYLIAADAGSGTYNVYSLAGERAGSFSVAGNSIEVGDAEGITAISAALGKNFPDGALAIADEDAGDYKLVSWSDIARTLSLSSAPAPEAATANAARIVKPVAETEPADSYGDAADDPAIWVDRDNPSRSVVIGTDKKLGLNVYDLKGKRLQVVPDGRMNNVDLRDGFLLGGKPTTVVAATNRTTKSISVYRLDHKTRQLTSIADGTLDAGFEDPYGLCMYHSAKTGDFYILANDSADGKVRQWKLVDRNGKVGIEAVRDIAVGSQAEGCAADDELGNLFVAEEDVGLWKYSAEPIGGDTRTAVDSVDGNNLTADAEGVSIYYGTDGKGFVILSNQGEDNYAVYRREGANEFVGKFHVVANEALGIDGASETDGLDVVSAPLGADLPMGLLVVQDGRNLMPAERQNFKFVSWEDVAETLRGPSPALRAASP
jgi:3-phytase